MAHRPLSSLLSWLLLTASVAIMLLLLVLRAQFEQQFAASLRGTDMVLGAKGSPLQLVLSAVYHLDHPTGNIPYAAAQKWMRHPFVQQAVPLAYGDSYKGFGLVGTTPDYLTKFNVVLAKGAVFQHDFEVTVGSTVARQLGLNVGDNFLSTHGLAAEGVAHEQHPYTVAGILAPTGTVVDNLLLSNLNSVWEAHAAHEHHEQAGPTVDSTREITAVLFKFKSPMALVQWPRLIAQTTQMQLAAPSLEVNRLFSLLGVGIQGLQYLGGALMVLAGLSVFISLFNALRERRYELALLRTLGAGRGQVFWLVLAESLWLCLAGFVSGYLLSRAALWAIGRAADRSYHLAVDIWQKPGLPEGVLLFATVATGILAALLPAWRAYRMDISQTLAAH